MKYDQVVEMLRREVSRAGAQSRWAESHGMSQSYVANVLRGRNEPGPLVLEALGLERVVTYRRIKQVELPF